MAHITIEYMILIPVLILQIFLLPYATGIFMSYWTTSSETLALNDASIHISSSIEQLYFFLNNPSVSSGTVTNNLGTSSIHRKLCLQWKRDFDLRFWFWLWKSLGINPHVDGNYDFDYLTSYFGTKCSVGQTPLL